MNVLAVVFGILLVGSALAITLMPLVVGGVGRRHRARP